VETLDLIVSELPTDTEQNQLLILRLCKTSCRTKWVNPWPYWPFKKTSSSHEEGCDRNWLINTGFIANEQGVLVGLKTVEVAWKMTAGNRPN
jgi:NADPH-dependent glutamate synthase beta subunit-like oxidoreductase